MGAEGDRRAFGSVRNLRTLGALTQPRTIIRRDQRMRYLILSRYAFTFGLYSLSHLSLDFSQDQ